MGATNLLERVAASVGQLGAVAPAFQAALDIPHGGVLLALPALLVSGLLRHARKYFQLPRGYYGLESIFLLLAFMGLARLKSIEALRYCAPGEWGKLLGLDRIPEVRTLRAKIRLLAQLKQAVPWSAELCAEWMAAAPESAAVLYIDGHVRIYHGYQTPLPKHYVARERLCLRATIDYWVNALDGQPFFVVNQAVDPGLLRVLENEIVPRLEKEVPAQPSAEQFAADPWRHRFTLVFDREGYSPAFFLRMKQKRIACLSYHKYPGENWPEEEFVPCQVTLNSGERVEMQLAERGTFLGGQVWVREIRKLTQSGHQTALLTTDYCSDLAPIAGAMFARWSQENFFKYMREHYNLDGLVDYYTEAVPETTRVVNPAYRALDGQVRSQAATLSRKLAEFGAINLEGEIESEPVEAFQKKKAELQEAIAHFQHEMEVLKRKRKAVKQHITVAELPEEARFQRLSTQSKHFIDTIKMIAYRAETAMAYVLREQMARFDDARSLLRATYSTEVDLLPNEQEGTLTVRLHHLANHSSDDAIRHLCTELNATETTFPGTNLRLLYELVSAQNPRDQEV
ncbi:MAG: putative transposase [Gammaproteobacteria bacterium]